MSSISQCMLRSLMATARDRFSSSSFVAWRTTRALVLRSAATRDDRRAYLTSRAAGTVCRLRRGERGGMGGGGGGEEWGLLAQLSSMPRQTPFSSIISTM